MMAQPMKLHTNLSADVVSGEAVCVLFLADRVIRAPAP